MTLPLPTQLRKFSAKAHLRISCAIAFGFFSVTHAAEEIPKPQEALAKPTEVAFLTAISAQIDGLEPGQIPTYRALLIHPSSSHADRVRTATDMLDHHWAETAPQELLEAAASGKERPSPEAQGTALRLTLSRDVEAAIRHYFEVPAYEDFAQHCIFYRNLSSIDPSRAVRLYFESPDQYRTFLNPLEIAFETWAKRDFPTAWNKAAEITTEKKRRSIYALLVKTGAPSKPKDPESLIRDIRNQQDREWLTKYLKPDPTETTQPKPADAAPPQEDEKTKLALEEAAMEQMFRDGYAAYDEKKTNDAYYTLQRMIARHPERTWEWLADMKSTDSYADMRYRELAQHWPREKLAADTERMLNGTRSREVKFGLHLGTAWLRHDPEAAIPRLFSHQAKHRRAWAGSMPHHTMVTEKKWTQEQIIALIDKIEDPESRTLAHREVKRDFIMRLPHAEAVAAIAALENKEDIDHIVPTFIFYEARGQSGRAFTDLVLAIDPKRTYARDQMLHLMPKAISERETADVTAIPDIVNAISDPLLRLQAIIPVADYRTPPILAAPLLETLFQLPASKARDRAIQECIRKLSAPDHLALITKSKKPSLRATLAKSLPTEGWSEEDFARCLEIIHQLPPAWTTDELATKWRSAAIARTPKDQWAKAIRDLYESQGASSYFHQKMSEWLKADPQALMNAIEASGTLPHTAVWRMQALLKTKQDDHATTFRHMRAHPQEYLTALPAFFDSWRAANGRQAAAHSLLVTQDQVRLSIMDVMIRFWTQTEREAASNWVKSLPPGEERTVALRELIVRLSYGSGGYPEWILPELPANHPARPKSKSPKPKTTVTKPEKQQESIEAQREQARQNNAAREARTRTIATIRSLAMIDQAEVVASIQKLPDSPHKTDSLLGLLEHASATGNHELRKDMISQLRKSKQPSLTEASRIILLSIPLENIDEAIAYEQSLTYTPSPDSPEEVILTRYFSKRHQHRIRTWIRDMRTDEAARDAAAEIILTRWNAPPYQARIRTWIAGIPDPDHRATLTEKFLRSLIQRAQSDPSLMPDVEPVLQRIIGASARKDLIHAHLEGRQPDPQTREQAALPEPMKGDVLRLFEARKPE
jgi:hypothetical protein